MTDLKGFAQGEVSQNGKIWALLSYAAHFFAIPIGIVPLLMGDDPYAVHHAKHAVAVYLATLIVGVVVSVVFIPLTMCTFGMSTLLLIPLALILGAWPLIHAIHGVVLALNGSWEEPIGTFGLGDKLFGSLHADKFKSPPTTSTAHTTTPPVEQSDAASELTIDVPAEVSQP